MVGTMDIEKQHITVHISDSEDWTSPRFLIKQHFKIRFTCYTRFQIWVQLLRLSKQTSVSQ